MSYDFDGLPDRSAPMVTTPIPHPSDLESIVTLLEIAAITLTTKPGDTFTRGQLLAQARVVGGSDACIEDRDVAIVLPGMRCLVKVGASYRLK
jgi:hypothetical protein